MIPSADPRVADVSRGPEAQGARASHSALRRILIAVALGAAVGSTYVVVGQMRVTKPPATYAPLPWAAGQWRSHRVVEQGRSDSITRVAVDRRTDAGFWVEQEHVASDAGTERSEVLFERQPTTPEDALDFAREVTITRADGTVVRWTSAEKARDDNTIKAVAAAIVSVASLTDTVPGALQDMTVPAGRFRQCMKADATVATGRSGMVMSGWFHPSVPLGGMVQGQTADGLARMELLDYGPR